MIHQGLGISVVIFVVWIFASFIFATILSQKTEEDPGERTRSQLILDRLLASGLNFTDDYRSLKPQVVIQNLSQYTSPNGSLKVKVVTKKEIVTTTTLVFPGDTKEVVEEVHLHLLVEQCISKIKSNDADAASRLLDEYRQETDDGLIPHDIIQRIVNECAIPATWSSFDRFFDMALKNSEEEESVALIAFVQTPEAKRRFFARESVYDIFRLGFGVYKMLSFPIDEHFPQETKNRYRKVFDHLPNPLKLLVTGGPITLRRNTHFNKEYFYAADSGLAYDNDRRNVFTWIPGDCCVDVKKCFWIFEHVNGTGFLIKNAASNEYLYPAMDEFNYDANRRRVFTWRPGGRGKDEHLPQMTWDVEMPTNTTLKLYSQKFKRGFLHASKILKDKDRRFIFMWTNKVETPHALTYDDEWFVEPGSVLTEACRIQSIGLDKKNQI